MYDNKFEINWKYNLNQGYINSNHNTYIGIDDFHSLPFVSVNCFQKF